MSKSGLSSSLSEKWESLLNNLDHSLRKLDRYQESISFRQQALLLSPLNPRTYSTLGYMQTLTDNLTNAMESYHKALVTSVIERLMVWRPSPWRMTPCP